MAMHPVDAQECRDQPADGREEDECNVRFPLRAGVARVDRDARPVKNIAARPVKPVDQKAKRDKPQDRDEQIGGPVDEAAGKGEQPDDGKQNGKAGDNFGIDEATLVPGRGATDGMKVDASETGNNGGKSKLDMCVSRGA